MFRTYYQGPPTMNVAQKIAEKLTAALEPDDLSVIDESHLHAGHAGARPQGESHFRVEIVAGCFTGQSRVARQRLVYGLLKEEMASDIHALVLVTKSPDEVR